MIDNEQMLKSLNELCSFESVAVHTGDKGYPFGKSVNEALHYVLDLCAGFGFRTKNCNEIMGWAEIGQGEELFGILVHLDVVPAGGNWDYPPYAATIANDRIYGRGVVDDKGPAIASIYAMKDILDSGVPLNKRVRIIFGGSEENGAWDDMEYYCEHEDLPTYGITPDADFPALFGEKGIFHGTLTMPVEAAGIVDITGGHARNIVPDAACIRLMEEGRVREYTAVGKSSHGSMPQNGENAIAKLMAKVDCPLSRIYNDIIGDDCYGGRMGIAMEDEPSGKLTLNNGMAYLEEDKVCLTLDIRYPVTVRFEPIREAVEERIKPYGISLSVEEYMEPLYMDKDCYLIKELMSVYKEVTARDDEPFIIGGGSYARAMDNIVAFGPVFPDRENTEHQANENILLADFLLLRKIYGEMIKKLCCDN